MSRVVHLLDSSMASMARCFVFDRMETTMRAACVVSISGLITYRHWYMCEHTKVGVFAEEKCFWLRYVEFVTS